MSSHAYSRPRDRYAFEVAIICALSLEADAMIALFDDFWEREEQFEKADGDTNSYTIGRLGQHHVVLVHMSRMGKISAANAAANLRSSFPRIRLALLVGICGAVPFMDGGKREIILGDVIISTQVIQTDFGSQYSDEFVRKNTVQDNIGRPSLEIQGFLASLQNKHAQAVLEAQIQKSLIDIKVSRYPGAHEDKLFETTYRHKHQHAEACAICGKCANPEDRVCVNALKLLCAELDCDPSHLILRARIQKVIDEASSASICNPMVHFGAVASGDQVIKSAQHRDRIADRENVIAFEMEGAGLWEIIPTIAVKGVCDYADSHKNKGWQLHAAMTAATCAKGILQVWRPTVKSTQDGHHNSVPVPSPMHQVFNGNFTAGKNIHNSGNYTAESINF